VPIVLPLVALDVLVVVLWTIAVALAIALVMKYIGGVFRGVPVVGGYIAGAADAVAQVVTSAAGSLEHGLDKVAGAAWHQLSRYMDHLWNNLVTSSTVLVHMSEQILRLTHAQAALRGLVHKAVGTAQAVLPRVRTLEREYHGIEHRVKSLERDIAKGIGHDLRISVKALEREVTGIEKQVIPGLRAGIKTAEGEVTDLERFIGALPGTRYLAWATGIVAAALGAGIFNFFRCPTFLNKTLGRGCGFWNGLEDLFGLFIDTLLLTNVCTLLPILETAVSEVADPLVIALTDVGAGLCSGGIGAAPPLQVPPLSLPANPSLALSLP
jgi:hypothetical protein